MPQSVVGNTGRMLTLPRLRVDDEIQRGLPNIALQGGLFAATLYAGYLGWQWRRTREAGEELRAMKASAPKGEDGNVTGAAAVSIAAKEAVSDAQRHPHNDTHSSAFYASQPHHAWPNASMPRAAWA